ncbi:MAG: hypothetical protein LBB34_01140 [Holosporales bacterium]|nr:hypothetical protein [Holosporales bacterium]
MTMAITFFHIVLVVTAILSPVDAGHTDLVLSMNDGEDWQAASTDRTELVPTDGLKSSLTRRQFAPTTFQLEMAFVNSLRLPNVQADSKVPTQRRPAAGENPYARRLIVQLLRHPDNMSGLVNLCTHAEDHCRTGFYPGKGLHTVVLGLGYPLSVILTHMINVVGEGHGQCRTSSTGDTVAFMVNVADLPLPLQGARVYDIRGRKVVQSRSPVTPLSEELIEKGSLVRVVREATTETAATFGFRPPSTSEVLQFCRGVETGCRGGAPLVPVVRQRDLGFSLGDDAIKARIVQKLDDLKQQQLSQEPMVVHLSEEGEARRRIGTSNWTTTRVPWDEPIQRTAIIAIVNFLPNGQIMPFSDSASGTLYWSKRGDLYEQLGRRFIRKI